jgi:hypothetical protein
MAEELAESAKRILAGGSVKVRVKRSGMLQQMTFVVKRVPIGDSHYVELFLDRIIDTSELLRLANELGLPVEAQNGRSFPSGKGATDFMGL